MLGLCLAWLAEQEGWRVFVARLPDRDVPHADTLRNQGWLQCGLRYFDREADDPHAFGRKMRRAGIELHQRLGFTPPDGWGIVRAKDEADAVTFERRAEKMGLPVRRLPTEDAKADLGALHESNGVYLATPELPFREAELVTELRAQLDQRSVPIREGHVSVAPNASGSFDVTIGGVPIRARCTVLAAGAGNVPLLQALHLPRLVLKQTPLAVVPCPNDLKAPLYYDRSSGFSMVRHPTNEGAKLVIGTDVKRIVSFVAPPDRKVLKTEEEAFWQRMPPHIQARRGDSRITAGIEPYPEGGNDFRTWCSTPAQYQGLIVAIPGRATLAMDAAATLVDEVRKQVATVSAQPAGLHSSIGSPWSDPICMHYEERYRHLHDVEGAAP